MVLQKFACALVITVAIVVVVGQVNCNLLPGFERCDNTNTTVRLFRVDVCKSDHVNTPTCEVKRGSTVGFHLDFASAADFDQVYMHMDVTNYGFMTDACASALKCPIKSDKWQTLVMHIHVDEKLDAGESNSMQFYLTDAKTRDRLVCIKFPVTIV